LRRVLVRARHVKRPSSKQSLGGEQGPYPGRVCRETLTGTADLLGRGRFYGEHGDPKHDALTGERVIRIEHDHVRQHLDDLERDDAPAVAVGDELVTRR
jgi:hypothetical protein